MIEVADVFRRFAADYLSVHGTSVLPSHRRAIEDILDCRTAALGGQVWRCDACGTEVFSFHSCVMGKFSNGESAMVSHRIPAVLNTDGAASHPYIRDAKPRDVASSEPEPCQEKDDCSVTPACR
jgi:Transposase zinc-binding domain